MNLSEIIIAVVSLCALSVIIGIVLSMAEKAFHVEVNPLESAVREALPGSNCGGCGYAGCDALARACAARAIRLIEEKAVVEEDLCTACGRCVKACPHGLIELVPAASAYRVQCLSFARGREVINACRAGCIGCGRCAGSCPADAIVMEDQIARIDYGKCVQCGVCAEKCPRDIIRFLKIR